MCDNVLEPLQGGIALERFRDVLGTLRTNAVVAETASETQKDTSRGPETFVQKRARNIKEALT